MAAAALAASRASTPTPSRHPPQWRPRTSTGCRSTSAATTPTAPQWRPRTSTGCRFTRAATTPTAPRLSGPRPARSR
eukprot:8083771-Alexandrium_andersonii.AAC.1